MSADVGVSSLREDAYTGVGGVPATPVIVTIAISLAH